MVSFEFVYDLVKGSYSEKGRPSIDPVCLIKMLLAGYLYGIKSERRLTGKISLNIAYRWFCGFGMMGKIPDHSTFTKNRKLRWQSGRIFERIFTEIVRQCKESLIILRHLQQMRDIGVGYRRIALGRGYDTGAIHRGLEILGITGYIPRIDFPNSPDKYGFTYDPEKDCFICPEGEAFHFHRQNCNKSTGKYLRCYQIRDDACLSCSRRETCFDKTGWRRRILASNCYPAFLRGHERGGANGYLFVFYKLFIPLGKFS